MPVNGRMAEVKPFLQKNTIETTGLYGLNEENLTEMLRFANAAASMITTRKGALRVMPSQEEIRHLLEMK